MCRLYGDHFLLDMDRWLLELTPFAGIQAILRVYYFQKTLLRRLISSANIAIIASGSGWESFMRSESSGFRFRSMKTTFRIQIAPCPEKQSLPSDLIPLCVQVCGSWVPKHGLSMFHTWFLDFFELFATPWLPSLDTLGF